MYIYIYSLYSTQNSDLTSVTMTLIGLLFLWNLTNLECNSLVLQNTPMLYLQEIEHQKPIDQQEMRLNIKVISNKCDWLKTITSFPWD